MAAIPEPYCPRCRACHPPGKHVAAKTVVIQSRLHDQDVAGEIDLSGSDLKPIILPTSCEGKDGSHPPKHEAPSFNRDAYQALYMADRRAADAAGFGKGPSYKTVKQYREWKAAQPK